MALLSKTGKSLKWHFLLNGSKNCNNTFARIHSDGQVGYLLILCDGDFLEMETQEML